MECIKSENSYIEKYNDTYQEILQKGMRWLTLAPKNEGIGAAAMLKRWLIKLEAMVKIVHEMILVVEIGSNLNLHFHAVYSVKDRVKEFKYVNGWKYEAMVRVYYGEPKEGIRYLFKDIDASRAFFKEGTRLIYKKSNLVDFLADVLAQLKKTSNVMDFD